MKIINKDELGNLILEGITAEELNSGYDYSRVTDMSNMFSGCKSLREIPSMDTSNVTIMNYMFGGCKELREIPLMDTSSVTSMKNMFDRCNRIRDIDPYNFPEFDFSDLKNEFIRDKYPELYI